MEKTKKSFANKTRNVIFPAMLALAIFTVGILATNVSAQDVSEYPPIVQKLAERFNLNVGEVQEVFDEERDERRADAYASWAERLDDAVAEGKITVEQKELILDKHEEMQSKMEELSGLSFEERREEMQKLHEEMREWAQSNDISMWSFGPKGYGKGLMHHGQMMGPGFMVR